MKHIIYVIHSMGQSVVMEKSHEPFVFFGFIIDYCFERYQEVFTNEKQSAVQKLIPKILLNIEEYEVYLYLL